MKKTLEEQKERIINMMGQLTPSKSINEQWDDDRGDAEDFERESLRNDDMMDREYDDPEGGIKLDDHVYISISQYHFAVGNPNSDNDSIDITVKGSPDMGNLEIINVDPVGDYTEDEIQRATEMVKGSLNRLPTGFSFDLRSEKGEAEGVPTKI